MTTLTANRVEELFSACLAREGGIDVHGIMTSANLNVTGHEEEIGTMLADLPEEFQARGGGGWSFLNACDTKNGEQWTGMHSTMERLFMLGIAVGKARWLLPREMWGALPGGMPYVSVN